MKKTNLLIIMAIISLFVCSYSLAETTLSSCGNINSSGEYGVYSSFNYYSDILGYNKVCFNINANNVVLDCHGNFIHDIGSTSSGIFASINSRYNVTIKNCELQSYNRTFLITDSDYINIHDNIITRADVVLDIKDTQNPNTISFYDNDVYHYYNLAYLDNSDDVNLDIVNNNFLYNAYNSPIFIIFKNDTVLQNIINIMDGIDSNFFKDWRNAYPELQYRYLLDDNSNGIYDYTELTNNVYICSDGWNGGNTTCSNLIYESGDISAIAIDGLGKGLYAMVVLISLIVIVIIGIFIFVKIKKIRGY